eukprot:Sspe_Gene.91836::Locus_63471_Transcript_1_1_Confidence_1.000_Length_1072::g.91836::m.91836
MSMTRLLLFLMHERFTVGKGSFFEPYIRTLPKLMDTPAYYSKEDWKELRGTPLEGKVRAEVESWRRDFRRLRAEVFNQYPAVFPSEHYTWENYKWAQSITNTRSIWFDGRPNLVPFLDMINCKEGRNPKKVHRTYREGEYATTYAPWTFRRGDQVFENYGQSNFIYLYHHGFAIHPNSHDCAMLRPMDLTSTKLETKRDIITELGLDPHKDFCVKAGNVPREFMQLMRIAVLEPKEVRRFKKKKGTKKTFLRKTSRDNEMRAYDAVVELCNKYLEGFPTTAEDDEAILRDSALPFRKRMAVTYRWRQKRETLALLRWADEKIGALAAKPSQADEL